MNRRRFVRIALHPAVLLVALLVGACPAGADTDGFFLGLDMHSSRLGGVTGPTNPSPDAVLVEEAGVGVNLYFGWGITPSFPVRFSISGATHDTADPDIQVAYAAFTVDGMYLFRDPEPLRPYLYGGVGGFSLRSQKDALDWETTGPGVLLGGGLLSFFGDTFALDFSVRAELVNWDRTRATWRTPAGDLTAETPIEEEGAALKILVGGSWWW